MPNLNRFAPAPANPRLARLRTAVLAVLAALALWAVVEFVLGLQLRSPAFGDGEVADVGAGNVLVAALAGSLLGWAILEVLERVTSQAPKLWLAIALVALAISLGGPFGGSGIDADNRAVLAAMHVLVGGILIVGLYRSAAGQLDRP